MRTNMKEGEMSIIETDVKDNTENKEKNNTEITIIDESLLRDKIYEVRGVKVMLDFELAEIYMGIQRKHLINK